jgi:hypothetical protein
MIYPGQVNLVIEKSVLCILFAGLRHIFEVIVTIHDRMTRCSGRDLNPGHELSPIFERLECLAGLHHRSIVFDVSHN